MKNYTEAMNIVNKKRPLSITFLSLFLIFMGIFLNILLLNETLEVVEKAQNSFNFMTVVYSIIVLSWILISVSGFGLLFGKNWARKTLIIALVCLFYASTFPSWLNVTVGETIGRLLLFSFIVILTFTPSANKFLKK